MNFLPEVILFFNYTLRMFEHVCTAGYSCLHEAALQPLRLGMDMENRRARPMEMPASIKNLFCIRFHCQHSDLRILAGQFFYYVQNIVAPSELIIKI